MRKSAIFSPANRVPAFEAPLLGLTMHRLPANQAVGAVKARMTTATAERAVLVLDRGLEL